MLRFLRAYLGSVLGGFLAVVGLVAVPSCATSSVAVDFDKSYDFSGAQTYAWVTDELVMIEFGKSQPRVRTEANELKIRAAVDRELQARGMIKVARSEAAVLAAFSVGVRMSYRLEGGNRADLISGGPGKRQTKGTLNVYLLDRASEREVWHGSVSKWLQRSDDPDAVVNEAVHNVLVLYPGDTEPKPSAG